MQFYYNLFLSIKISVQDTLYEDSLNCCFSTVALTVFPEGMQLLSANGHFLSARPHLAFFPSDHSRQKSEQTELGI